MGVFHRLFKTMPGCPQTYEYRLEDMDASRVIRWKTLAVPKHHKPYDVLQTWPVVPSSAVGYQA